MKKISSPWHYLIISSKLTNLSTSSDPRSNCIYVLFVIHCVPIRLYFKFLANHQITWFFFHLLYLFKEETIFIFILNFFGNKKSNCETSVYCHSIHVHTLYMYFVAVDISWCAISTVYLVLVFSFLVNYQLKSLINWRFWPLSRV